MPRQKPYFTRELSACCALRGYQTLVIDSDPQPNLTASWIEPDIYNITLSHVLIEPEAQADAKLEPRDLDDAIVESPPTLITHRTSFVPIGRVCILRRLPDHSFR
jgi:cellulose biosynthesis protein BcsQ